MHGQGGNPRNRWTVKTASNNPGNLEANSDTCRFPIMFQIGPGKDGINIFRTLGPTLQGLCGWFKGLISRHPCRYPCGNGEHTTGNRVLPGAVETRCCHHARKGSWNSAVEQATDHSVARSERALVWTVSSDVYFADTQQTSNNQNPHPKANSWNSF
jgi:hypothetical protein